MRPEFLGHFLRAFYLSERPGAVTELLRGLREALAPEMVPSNPAISIHLNSIHLMAGRICARDISTAL